MPDARRSPVGPKPAVCRRPGPGAVRDRLADRVEQYNIRLYLFVLMTNHFHLVFSRYVHLNPVMGEGRHRPEDVAFRRVTQPLPAEVILKALAGGLGEDVEAFRQRRRKSALRAVAVRMLVRYGAQTQRQAAQRLGMGTGGAASAQARRLPGLLAQSRRLRRQVEQIEHTMERLRQERHPGAGERVP